MINGTRLNGGETAKVVLLTPRDIDRQILRCEGIKTDCTDVMKHIPLNRPCTTTDVIRIEEIQLRNKAELESKFNIKDNEEKLSNFYIYTKK